jgi:PadR family transcriptional regulator PadR
MASTMLEREMKRGSAELLILALLEDRERHGYDIGKQIEEKSDGTIVFHVTSLYPTLHRLQAKGQIEGRWVEKPGQRRHRYYRLTPGGRGVLVRQRLIWQNFARAINRVAGIKNL